MYYGNIKYKDIANGTGVRTSLFVSGCTHHCKGCFNPETWDFSYGKPFTRETEDEIIESLKPAFIKGITVLGGEPFEPENQKALFPFIKRLREELPDKTVWFFSGYTYEHLTGKSACKRCRCEVTDELLELTDVLVDGEFVEEKKNISLRFRGSSNQRIIDLNETRKQGEIVMWDK